MFKDASDNSKEIKNEVRSIPKEVVDSDGADRLPKEVGLENRSFETMSSTSRDGISEKKNIKEVKKMDLQITIEFKCPEGMDKKEFTRQIKGQERGLNSQTVAENMDNRAAFEQRKQDTGNGRDLTEGKKAQDIIRQKSFQSRIETNQKNGMSYSEAKAEAKKWIKTQDAIHNPDQIAGGNPAKVSRMGDATVNRSIGSQWRTRVDHLTQSLEDYAKGKTREDLENTKMNVKLVVI